LASCRRAGIAIAKQKGLDLVESPEAVRRCAASWIFGKYQYRSRSARREAAGTRK